MERVAALGADGDDSQLDSGDAVGTGSGLSVGESLCVKAHRLCLLFTGPFLSNTVQ